MTLQVIFDDAAAPSTRLKELIGIERFGDIRYRRKTLSLITREAIAAADLSQPIQLDCALDRQRLEEEIRLTEGPSHRYLICPSNVVPARGPDVLTLFLRQARYSPQNLLLPARNRPEWQGWALMSGPLLRSYLAHLANDDLPAFLEMHSGQFVLLEERLDLVDLNDEVTLLEFLSGTFDARYFNEIKRDVYTITKSSTDRGKLRREFALFDLLPSGMRMYFISPFDFVDGGETASYRMERLLVPDMAVQWLHEALTEGEFQRFLDQVFHFVDIRAKRASSGVEVDRVAQALFVEKVVERVAAFKTCREYALLEPLIDRACGGIDSLLARYLALFERWRDRLPDDHLVVGHGDLCFSNILYAKSNRTMKLIDPRGASEEADLWTHPYYDVAKLSHSILGDYDFVNQDMFDIRIDESIKPVLVIDKSPNDWAAAAFNRRLDESGFDRDLVRMCEASLFISMLPLHVDRPRKVLGFILVATRMLDLLEGKNDPRRERHRLRHRRDSLLAQEAR